MSLDKPKKAYLYSRVSTSAQGITGDGIRRQEKKSRDFVASLPEYDIAESLSDIGKSGYHANNIAEDADLGKFLSAARNGLIEPSSLLVIEAPDRLTRLGITKGQQLFAEIADAKIDVAMVNFGIIIKHDDDNDLMGNQLIAIGLYLGNMESKQKAIRVRAAKERGQQLAINGEKRFTTTCPKWLTPTTEEDNTKAFFKPHSKHRVKIIKEIFDMYINQGMGFTKIANTLNDRNEPTWAHRGNSWQKTYIMNIIKGRAVLGEYHPNVTDEHPDFKIKNGLPSKVKNKTSRAKKLIDSNSNYYPQIIPPDTWAKAHVIWKKSSTGKGTNTGKGFPNLFTQGVAVCGNCNKNMHYIPKGRNYTYLVCPSNQGNSKRCPTRNVPYNKIETIILAASETINYTDILTGENSKSQQSILSVRSSKIRTEIDTITAKINNFLDWIGAGKSSEAIDNNLNIAEKQKKKLQMELAQINYKIGELNTAAEHADDIGSDFIQLHSIMKSMTNIDDLEVLRTKLHRQFKSVFEKISISFEEQWLITYHFKNSDIINEIRTHNIKPKNYQWFDITNNKPMHPITRGHNLTHQYDHDYGSEYIDNEFETKNL